MKVETSQITNRHTIAMTIFRSALASASLFLSATGVFAAENKYLSDVDCFIEPFYVVNVGCEVIGVLDKLEVDRGDFVKRGQVIARLDSKVEQEEMQLRKARLEFAKREHQRRSDLYLKGFISFLEVDESETQFRISERELQEAVEVLERRTVRSPIDGVVVERYLSPGERVEEKPIMKLAQLDPLRVEVIAPVSMLNSVKVGQQAAVTPENPVGGRHIGKVTVVDRVIDAASGTFGIRIELPNSDYSVPAGLKCEVRFLKK